MTKMVYAALVLDQRHAARLRSAAELLDWRALTELCLELHAAARGLTFEARVDALSSAVLVRDERRLALLAAELLKSAVSLDPKRPARFVSSSEGRQAAETHGSCTAADKRPA